MSRKSRWFENPYPDYEGETSTLTLDKEALKRQGLQMLEDAFGKGAGDGDGGLYVGAVGLTYTFLHVQHLLSPEDRENYGKLARKAFDTQSNYYLKNKGSRNDLCAFLLGQGGYFATGAVFGSLSNGQEDLTRDCVAKYVEAAQICKPLNFFKDGGDELFVGRAGYLCGALWMEQKLGYMPVPKKDLLDIWNSIIESGQKYAQLRKSPSPLMYSYYNTEYLGAAHGLCSILQVLLSFPVFLNENPKKEALIKSTLDFYLTLQDFTGNFPCAMDEIGLRNMRSEAEMLVHWCHGAPGAVYLFAKAYLRYKDQKYLDACIRCGELVWSRGLLRKGPGICHGVAGSGYVFLLIHNLLERKDPKHLYRAMKFAEFLLDPKFKEEARRPDCPYSLFEGIAGTACFVFDLLQPEKAEFPFFNVGNNFNG